MGRIYEASDESYHEGYPIGLCADGTEVSGWGGPVPAPEIVAARPACDCGWRGTPIPTAELAERCGLDAVTHDDLIDWEDGEPGGIVLDAWEHEHVASLAGWRTTLTTARQAAEAAQQALVRAVAAAREHGASWADIGAEFGISRQAAHERFARAVARQAEADRPTEPLGRTIQEQVRDAYHALATGPGAWISLTRLRAALAAVDRNALDDTLRTMEQAADVFITPEANQKALTAADRAAAIVIGRTPKHLICITTIDRLERVS